MTTYILIGVAVLAVLVWAGRRPARVSSGARLLSALFSAMAAVAAVVSAMRGGWIPSLILVVCSVFLGARARRTVSARADPSSQSAPPPPFRPATPESMTAAEARAILGVGGGAGPEQINAAYRRLMLRAHPDHGGSTGLAMQLNAARDRLLRKTADSA